MKSAIKCLESSILAKIGKKRHAFCDEARWRPSAPEILRRKNARYFRFFVQEARARRGGTPPAGSAAGRAQRRVSPGPRPARCGLPSRPFREELMLASFGGLFCAVERNVTQIHRIQQTLTNGTQNSTGYRQYVVEFPGF